MYDLTRWNNVFKVQTKKKRTCFKCRKKITTKSSGDRICSVCAEQNAKYGRMAG